MKVNYKQLKAALALEIRKLGPTSLVSKLGEFPLFDSFLDLANFLPFEFPNLDNFRLFDNFPIFNNFLSFSIDLLPPSILPTSLAANTLSATSTYDNTVVFSIDVSSVAILLKP